MGRPGSKPSPDIQYRSWLGKRTPSVPCDVAGRWFDQAIVEFGNVTLAATHLGLAGTILRALRERDGSKGVQYDKAWEMARKAHAVHELVEAMPPPGLDDWSEHGRFCGDGAGPLFDGCGTFHHDHHVGGLCEECFTREAMGVTGIEPRDIRVSRGVKDRARQQKEWNQANDCRVRRGTGVRDVVPSRESDASLRLWQPDV